MSNRLLNQLNKGNKLFNNQSKLMKKKKNLLKKGNL